MLCSKENTGRNYSYSVLRWLDKNVKAAVLLDFGTSLTQDTIYKGFKNTGIYPINPNAEKLRGGQEIDKW